MRRKYTLSYLPLFGRDLEEAWRYIALRLRNPEAADKLVADTEMAILKRLEAPDAFEARHVGKKREHAYYRIKVRNFAVWYVVLGNVMEVRRFLYGKRDIRKAFGENENPS
jgi:plasmid stabilization system protein ParE